MKTTLTVEGMTCSACVAHVKHALARPEIQAVEVRLADGIVTIEHEPSVGLAQITALLGAAGYSASERPAPVPAPAPALAQARGCCCSRA